MKYLDIPPVWLALMIGLAALVGRYFGFHDPVLVIGGVGLMASGLLMALIAAIQLIRTDNPLHPHGTATQLVTTGVFAISRNPIYLAGAMVLAGATLAVGGIVALPILLPTYLYVMTRRFIRPEERRLSAASWRAYRAYRKSTRRWM